MRFIIENVLEINWVIWISWVIQLMLYFKYKNKYGLIFWSGLFVLFLAVIGKAILIEKSLDPGPQICDPYMAMSILSVVVGLGENILVFFLSKFFNRIARAN